MPSDKCNMITANYKAMGLIFLLFDIALSLDVPFGTLKYVQYILYGLTRVLLCVPFVFAHHKRYRFCGRHMMPDGFNELSVIFIDLDLAIHNKNIHSPVMFNL